ncbi:hypothetical protein CF327_g7225 [Tilletia walkeri]|nr:hypothetical protein CF327_g7225 [Tilletia walkeri]
MNEPSIEGSAAASPAQASASAEPASNTAVKVGGRTTKVRTDGVAYTPEKKMIAVFLAFSGSGKGKKGKKRKREDAEEKLGCKSTALYRWKKAYPEAAAARDEAIDAVGAIGKILATIRSRSDEANLAAFLVPEFSVPMPSSNPAGPTSGGGQLVVRPDGLGPTSELGPGSMPLELLACLRLVDDDSGGELTDEERDRLSIAVDADVPEAGEELVYHSMTLGAKLAYSNLAKGTAGLWKGPQQKYILKSKSNRDARPERGVAARHRDVEVCSVGAFAMYLFFRFHVFSEPVPDFSSRDSWYRIKLLIDHETHGSKFKGSKKGPVGPTFSISCKDGLRSSRIIHEVRSTPHILRAK